MNPYLAISLFRTAMVAIITLYSVVSSAAEMKLKPAERDLMTAVIQKFGYNCLRAKIALPQGPDAYGDVLKVWCGPRDRDGIYRNTVFRVTLRPNNTMMVVPWRD